MADFTASTIINCPVDEVFQYASSLENAPDLMPNVVRREKLTDGPLGKGTKVLEIRNIRGRELQYDVEYLEYEENRFFKTRSYATGLESIYEYEFHEIEEGTQVQFFATIKTKGLRMMLSRKLLLKMIKQEDGYQLQYLKEALEKQEETQ